MRREATTPNRCADTITFPRVKAANRRGVARREEALAKRLSDEPLALELAPDALTGTVGLQNLHRTSCRWPMWADTYKPDSLFCGRPVDGERSYCTEHRKRGTGVGTPSERAATRPPDGRTRPAALAKVLDAEALG